MAPFKLKFRMGSSSTSRSVSQETDEPVQQPLLTRQFSINSSNTTIDCEFNNMDSNAEQHNLLPNHSDVDDDTGKCIALICCLVRCDSNYTPLTFLHNESV